MIRSSVRLTWDRALQYRCLGGSGFDVSVLSFGTATFGGVGPFYGKLGSTSRAEARRLIDVCIDHGITTFDTADSYSDGLAEAFLGEAIVTRRSSVRVSHKIAVSSDAQVQGMSFRKSIVTSLERSLSNMGTDYVDLLQLHVQYPPGLIEDALRAFDDLLSAGKARAVGCSNLSGWFLLKSQMQAERMGLPRYCSHQVCYSLLHRDFEWELRDVAIDQELGVLAWSPLGWGRLTGHVRRDRPPVGDTRAHNAPGTGPPCDPARLFDLVDVLADVARAIDKTVPQVALNWLLSRPAITSAIIGARTERQLVENIGAVGWSLPADCLAALDSASTTPKAYPRWLQDQLAA